MLAAFTILFTAKVAVKLDWSDTSSQIKIYSNQYIYIRNHVIEFLKNRVPQDFCLPALQPAIKPLAIGIWA